MSTVIYSPNVKFFYNHLFLVSIVALINVSNFPSVDRSYDEPRLTAWYGKLPYTYSRLEMQANPEVRMDLEFSKVDKIKKP